MRALGVILVVASGACGGQVSLPGATAGVDSGLLAPAGTDALPSPSPDLKPTTISYKTEADRGTTQEPDTRPSPDTRPPPDLTAPPPKSCPCAAGHLCVNNTCHAPCNPTGACKVDSSCPASEACVAGYQNNVYVGHYCVATSAGKGQACANGMCQNHLVCLSTNGGPYSCQPCPL